MLSFTQIRTSPILCTLVFSLIIVSALAPMAMYAVAQLSLYPKGWRRFRHLPFLSMMGVGIAISNSRAVLEAFFGKETPFIRTPKSGDHRIITYRMRFPYVAFFEVGLGMYCFISLGVYFHSQTYIVGPFLLLYALGFTLVGFLSIAHAVAEARWTPHSAQLAQPKPAM